MFSASILMLSYVIVVNFMLISHIFVFSRGVLFGVWSSCASVGNIIGALMAAAVLSYGYQVCLCLIYVWK